MDGVTIYYVSNRGSRVVRYFRWLWSVFKECRKEYDKIFIKYFPGCSLLVLLQKKKNSFILDIRTGSVQISPIRRWIEDRLLLFESKAFSCITIISDSLADKLYLQTDDYHILPLGAEQFTNIDKSFESLHLLYVGTLSRREIEKTIIGFGMFYNIHKNEVDLKYTVVGDGYSGEIDKLKSVIKQYSLQGAIELLGFIHQTNMLELWNECNVGVAYIPINSIYNCQPSTKTFEYLMAGMPTIATRTHENSRIINTSNGVLINDDVIGFFEGLNMIFEQRAEFNSAEIKKSVQEYHWKNIFLKQLLPLIVSDNK